MKLEILTRCTRPENLLRIRQSILNVTTDHNITWRIIFDVSSVISVDSDILYELDSSWIWKHFIKGVPEDMGHDMLNQVISQIDDDSWIYVLDDDNILHENFSRVFELIQEFNPDGLIFSQHVGGKDFSGLDIRVAAPENVCVGKIDMAQFMVKKTLLGESKFVSNKYEADGILITELYENNKDKFLIKNEVLCYYNFLNKDKSIYTLPRILLSGDDIKDIRTVKYADYESDELFLVNCGKDDIDENIIKNDPDCFVSIGDDYTKFKQLCKLPFDFRQRWIHKENTDNIGEISYQCAMHSILNQDTSRLVSIFTPVYKTGEKLRRTYQSVKNQTYDNWEWVLLNDSDDKKTNIILDEIAKSDPRVKLYEMKSKSGGIIGESKFRACVLSRGNFLFELDHDDYLTPDALQLIMEAFDKYPNAGFVYSDCAEVDENYNSLTYGEGFALGYGQYKTENHFNRDFKFAVAPNINPLSIRHIVGVPNHFRAWKRESYLKAGCHNRRLSIADDYELIIRTFLTTEMVKIPRGCYLQFFHGSNSQDATRADIQRRVRTISHTYNKKIKQRFEEFGKEDWAYSEIHASVNSAPRYGSEEGYVNHVYLRAETI